MVRNLRRSLFLASLVDLRSHEGDLLLPGPPEFLIDIGVIDEDGTPSDGAWDYAFALIGGGIPAAFHLAHALANRDKDGVIHYAKVEAAVLATQYSMLKFLNWYSPKNAMSFHKLHQGVGVLRNLAYRVGIVYGAPVWAAAVSAKTGSKLAKIHPGQNMQSLTGIHWSSGGDVGSGQVIGGVSELDSFTWESIGELFGVE